MTQFIPVLTLSVIAQSDIEANRFIRFDGEIASARPGVLGVTRTAAKAGEIVAVTVQGTAVVQVMGECKAGDPMQVYMTGYASAIQDPDFDPDLDQKLIGYVAPGSSTTADGGLAEILIVGH